MERDGGAKIRHVEDVSPTCECTQQSKLAHDRYHNLTLLLQLVTKLKDV